MVAPGTGVSLRGSVVTNARHDDGARRLTRRKRDAIYTLLDVGYVDGFRRLFPDDIGHTFPVYNPHVRLDYVFLPNRYAERLKSIEIVKQPPVVQPASDHYPLLAELEV